MASLPPFVLVLEEVVADELLLVVDVLLGAVADDHVVDALERVARDLRALADDLEVVLEGAFPRKIAVELEVLHRRNFSCTIAVPNLDHRAQLLRARRPVRLSMKRLVLERASRGRRGAYITNPAEATTAARGSRRSCVGNPSYPWADDRHRRDPARRPGPRRGRRGPRPRTPRTHATRSWPSRSSGRTASTTRRTRRSSATPSTTSCSASSSRSRSAHPELVTSDSPTQRVGGAISTTFDEVRHRRPMLSLGNAFSHDELRAFDTRVRRGLGLAAGARSRRRTCATSPS